MLIERASPSDLMALPSDLSGAPLMVGAILVLDTRFPMDPTVMKAAIADRIRAVPRLRQRLVRAPHGCGRPAWVDDPGFDIGNHVRTVICPTPGDESALLGITADIATLRLPRDRPLWSATVVTELGDCGVAVIVMVHHVLADGIGGLAILARLVDGVPAESLALFPRRPPCRRAAANAYWTHCTPGFERWACSRLTCAGCPPPWPSCHPALGVRRGPR